MINFLDRIRIKLNKFLIRLIKLISAFGLTPDSRLYWKRHKNEKKWLADGGELGKKTDFDFLNENSIVVDIGGYTGEFIAPLVCKYGCNVISYEPVPDFYKLLQQRFLKNKKVKLVNSAVGAREGSINLNLGDAGTSSFLTPENSHLNIITSKIENIVNIVNKFNNIDLLALNCEGAEYEIIDEIIKFNLCEKIKCFFIQFHDVNIECKLKRTSLINMLALSHEIIYDYPWVWTRLDRKN